MVVPHVILRTLIKAEACMWNFYFVLKSKIISVISHFRCLCCTGRIISNDHVLADCMLYRTEQCRQRGLIIIKKWLFVSIKYSTDTSSYILSALFFYSLSFMLHVLNFELLSCIGFMRVCIPFCVYSLTCRERDSVTFLVMSSFPLRDQWIY